MNTITEIVRGRKVAADGAEMQQAGLGELADFIARISYENFPATLLHHARQVAADLIGTIAAGMREPEMHRLALRLASGGAASVIGHPVPASPSDAALLHGTAGTFLELDEGNRFSRGHPGIHVMPAALAVAQQRGATGAQLLTALICGYEVAARIGVASEIRPVMHPHGTWGTVGAAVAVRKLLGGSAEDFMRTINVASTLGLATSVKAMREGGTVRNVFAGVSGKMAILANELVDSGFSAESDGLTSVYDGIISHGFEWSRMLEGLGERWEMQRNYFKLHACCRFNHAALDALAQALQTVPRPLDTQSIETIEVQTYSLAAALSNPHPCRPLAAKYSLPFAIATSLVHGSTGVKAFSQSAVVHLDVLRLALRVRVNEDAAMTKLLPDLRQARVILRMKSGQQYVAAVHTNRGDSENPLSDEELAAKFMDLSIGTWTKTEAARLHERVLALELEADVSNLFKLQ